MGSYLNKLPVNVTGHTYKNMHNIYVYIDPDATEQYNRKLL